MPRLTNGTAVIECDDATAEKLPPGWRPVDEIDDLDDTGTNPEGDHTGEDPDGSGTEGDDPDGDDEADDARTDWTIEQLRAFAAENEIDLGKTKAKDKILAIIDAALADDEDDDLDDDETE